MENIFKLNEKVWKSGATEIIKFKYLGNEYHLIQTETPSKSAGNTYVYRKIGYSEFEPILYINWQSSGTHAYVKSSQFTSGSDSEGIAILHYILSSDEKEYGKLIRNDLLTIDISDGSSLSYDDWLNFEYYGTELKY